MLTPFALAQVVVVRGALGKVFWFAVVLLVAAAIVATVSRAPLVAWLLAVATFVVVWRSKSVASRAYSSGMRWLAGSGVAVLGLVVVAVLATQSTFLRDRLAASGSDLSIRVAHWSESVELMRPDALHVLFGMGLGSFPREFYVAHAATRELPAYRLERDPRSKQPYLALTGGRGMYVDQRIAAKPGDELTLRGQVRSLQAGARLSVMLCEKSFLNSVGCRSAVVPAPSAWQSFEVRLRSPQQAGVRFAPAPPVALSLHNGAFGTRVEVTQLSLADAQSDLLRNGSFDRGLDHWLVASDVHLAWRVLNTPLQIVFEQGLLGAAAWLLLCVAGIAAVVRPSASPATTAAFAAAGIGFLAVGCFDSLLDAPRVTLLAALTIAAGLLCASSRTIRFGASGIDPAVPAIASSRAADASTDTTGH
jgi:hypothetical protein